MNSDLHQFVSKYLSVVFATLMAVSFFAFVSIPYGLGADPGDVRAAERLAQAEAQTPAPASTPAPLPEA
ncbi:hypothetical protein [Rhodoferax sp.]|uniref:hypothetical protein n=1 Tax=Rhodoferax sp. TaxID=50421 RepID=UPI0028483441|nr:hypothetical protein [Rhodoferax sp.]MDR3369138.1 hypothetical protein [Rhodoferax sp.]